MQEYQRALAEFPDDAAARNGLGFCYMQTRQWQEALSEYEYILTREPGNVIALSKTAELYGILGRRNEAYTAYMHLADLYSQAGQGQRAEAAWQRAVQLTPDNPEPHERLASYYFGKKDFSLMIQERLAAAQGYFAHGERVLARTQCEEVLRVDPQNAQAHTLLTHILNEHAAPVARDAMQIELSNRTSEPASFDASSSGRAQAGPAGNTSGGNTGIMGNMGSAGNYGGMNGSPLATAGNNADGAANARQRIAASQVTGALRQAQTLQAQGRFNDAIDLCEQILESGIDRPDARYFLGWLYQEQQRWDEAIRQFQMLLNDPDYALSCYYALGQCYRARGDLRTATVHFDEDVDRVNLDALTEEESDQLVQLCQEAAEAHRLLGEQEQALTVYHALLGFLKSRGWSEKVAQVEFMLQQAQNTPAPRPVSTNTARPQQGPVQAPLSDAATITFDTNIANGNNGKAPAHQAVPPSPVQPEQTSRPAPYPVPPAPPTQAVPTPNKVPNPVSGVGELPDWLTGILSDADKAPAPNAAPPQTNLPEQPTMEQRAEPPVQAQPAQQDLPTAQASWLTGDIKPVNSTRELSPDQFAQTVQPSAPQSPVAPPAQGQQGSQPLQQVQPVQQQPIVPPTPPAQVPVMPVVPAPAPTSYVAQEPPTSGREAEDLLSQIAGASSRDEELKHVAETVLTSTANLPENVRLQVVRSMQDIQKYINHGLLIPAAEECLRVIDMAPQYLDVHQVLCEIYVRQGKVEQAITKYAILVDTYIVNGRTDDAIATYRRILQLEPNNLTYRMRLINLLSTQGNKEDLLRERTLAAESYLRLGYMDRAVTELEQALQESPTSVPTRLNYALALQKLGRSQQAVSEYQRVLQIDPRNLTALVRWHIAMMTTLGTSRATMLEVLSRIRWQMRGEGQRHYETVVREYTQAADAHPNNADILYSLGQMHQQAGQYDKAIDAYEQAMRDSSVEVLARTSAAQCFLLQGRPEAAIQQFEQALQAVRRSKTSMDPAIWAARPREEGEEHRAPEVEISLLLAKAYERTGRREQMEAILRQVKQSKPEQNEVTSALAEISSRQGDVSSALREYTELVRHYRNTRQTENALRVLNEMVRLAPQDPRPHAELADIYIQRGLLDEGIAELRLLADIYLRRDQIEDASEVLQRAGDIYAEMGNNDEALATLCRAAELTPTSMEPLRSVVGFCLQVARQLELTNDPDADRYQSIAAKYQSLIAHHYFDTHQVKESVAALQQLITIDRNNYDAYDLLGQTYQSVGEYEQASRVYRNLARINPDSNVARERLAALQELRTR
jgi:tetratricopeptide (TPR) repeat protein